ncbi:MAG: SufE family protein [Candidatus Puniceispirillaceae bacterium]
MNRATAAAAEIIDEFSFLDDWEDRYQLLIDLGRQLPPLPDIYRSEEYRLRGCQSVVHFAAEQDGDAFRFHAGSDAAIVQGLIALLLRVYSDRTAAEILSTDESFLAEIGLDSHLSPTRKTGLASMLAAIKASAG